MASKSMSELMSKYTLYPIARQIAKNQYTTLHILIKIIKIYLFAG